MPSSTPERDVKAVIRELALAEGFNAVRFGRAQGALEWRANLDGFLAEGRHGGMDWLARDPERRADPIGLWPDAKSVVILGSNYGPDSDPLDALSRKTEGAISVYARGDDYHDVLKKKLKRVAGAMAAQFGAEVKVFIDTAPVMEKPLAQAAGLGWQGKHTNLVSRDFGSWLFIGSIFTTLDLEADAPEGDHCGQCHRCLDACTTQAFTGPYRIDARRCISYLTIEHKGHIPREFREAIGNRIYGCDDCLAVCPWNKFAQAGRETRLQARSGLANLMLRDLARLDVAGFRALFRGSPIKRIGRNRFVRNVLIAIGNSQDVSLAVEAAGLLNDDSPLVRAMAVWALARLLSERSFAALRALHLPAENDTDVRAEWTVASASSPVSLSPLAPSRHRVAPAYHAPLRPGMTQAISR